MAEQDVTPSLMERLTPRQKDVLQGLAHGTGDQEMAAVLGVRPSTVRGHVTAVLRVLGASTRDEGRARAIKVLSAEARVAEVLRRPAVAVLGVATLGEAPDARTCAAGVAADISALLSRWCWFPVLATGGISALPGGPGTPPRAPMEEGRLLGARFVVDGTLQVRGETWRLSLRAVDVEDGRVIWAHQEAIPAQRWLQAQDDLCGAVVAALYPLMVQRVTGSTHDAARAGNLQAWQLAHAGMALQARREEIPNRGAHDCFQAALDAEPQLVLAHFGMGLNAYDRVLNQWTEVSAAGDLLVKSAHRCLDLAPHAAEGHYLLGRWFQTRGDHTSAVRALESAVANNPSFAAAHALLAQALHLIGRSEEALVRMKHAERLGPRAYVSGLATLHFARHEHAQALEAAERAMALAPSYPYARALAAAAAHHLGDAQRAREHARRLALDHPGFVPERFLKTFGPNVEAVAMINSALKALGPRP